MAEHLISIHHHKTYKNIEVFLGQVETLYQAFMHHRLLFLTQFLEEDKICIV